MGRNDKGSVGFIGVGTMGVEMVRNLLKAGHAVHAFDLNEAAVADIVKEGAIRAKNPADAAQGADIVVTMLPDTPHVEATVYGEHGLLKSPPPGKLIVDMSTISPVAVRRIHADLQKIGVSFIDAPVSGGPVGAKNAALSIMAGGDASAFTQAEPFFRAMGTTITHVGASGAGQNRQALQPADLWHQHPSHLRGPRARARFRPRSQSAAPGAARRLRCLLDARQARPRDDRR
ncbi:3-hydroxyisobutyrate dehydrogenase-like beta-hydroxyacid dehydrogenase [Bradyrhizobium sp. GM5.1]